MDGIPTHAFFIRVLTHPATNPGDTAEVAELLCVCVHDTIRVETLQTHTVGATQEVEMEQPTSKRARDIDEDEVAYDDSDTGTSVPHPPVPPAKEHMRTPREQPRTPSQEREEAHGPSSPNPSYPSRPSSTWGTFWPFLPY